MKNCRYVKIIWFINRFTKLDGFPKKCPIIICVCCILVQLIVTCIFQRLDYHSANYNTSTEMIKIRMLFEKKNFLYYHTKHIVWDVL